MHEYSVVQALLEQIEDLAEQNEASKISKVVVKIGVMSGVEVHLLEVCFNTFKEKTICDGADFVVINQALSIECAECKKVSELTKREYRCPSCNSTDVKVIDGEDMFLMSLEME